MARGDNPTRGGYVESSDFHKRRKERLVESGTHVWAFNSSGHLTALRNDPSYLAKKVERQGYKLAEIVEETVKRPVIRASEPKLEEEPKPKRGPGRPRKVQTEDGE